VHLGGKYGLDVPRHDRVSRGGNTGAALAACSARVDHRTLR
jgi:hypothetical protein